MKDSAFRQSMGLLHSWGGLIAGWLGFAIFLTGTLAVFDDEITRWASPELAVAGPAAPPQVLAVLEELESRSPHYWFASLPSGRTPAMRAIWKDDEGALRRGQADPASGRWIEPRDTGGGRFFTEFHYTLHAGTIGTAIVAAVSVAMLVAMLSGIIVHRRIFKDFFTFRPRAKAQRRWLDLHNLLAVLGLPFLLMIVYTGLSIKSQTYLPIPAGPRPVAPARPLAPAPEVPPGRMASLAHLYAGAEAVLGPGRIAFVTLQEDDGVRRFVASRAIDDRLNLSTDTATFDRASGRLLGTTQVDRPAYLTQRVFAGLHFGHYGGLAVRWLYFLLGLGGTIMIGAGLVLFSIKRPERWRDAIGTTAVTSLCLACLVHLAAARWLPPDMADRPAAEAWLFFAAWLIAGVHALLRPWAAGWREQALVVAVLAAALAVADAFGMARSAWPVDAARAWVDGALALTALLGLLLGRRFSALVRDERRGGRPRRARAAA